MKDTQTVADAALAPIIEYTTKTVGSKRELTRKLSEALGRKMHRQVVEGWVHPDPKKRVQPSFGLGLALLAVGSKMAGRKTLDINRILRNARNGKAPRRAKNRS